MSDPADAAHRYIEAFNNADPAAMAAQCADPMQILDGMAPHVWQGPSATQEWWRDVLAESAHLGVGNYQIVLDQPRRVDVNGDVAYLVFPASMSFDQAGERRTQSGSTFIVALRRTNANWQLTAWSWAKGQ